MKTVTTAIQYYCIPPNNNGLQHRGLLNL